MKSILIVLSFVSLISFSTSNTQLYEDFIRIIEDEINRNKEDASLTDHLLRNIRLSSTVIVDTFDRSKIKTLVTLGLPENVIDVFDQTAIGPVGLNIYPRNLTWAFDKENKNVVFKNGFGAAVLNENKTVQFSYIEIVLEANIIQQTNLISFPMCNQFLWIRKCHTEYRLILRPLNIEDIDNIIKGGDYIILKHLLEKLRALNQVFDKNAFKNTQRIFLSE